MTRFLANTFVAASCMLSLSACTPPKRDLSVDEIAKLHKLSELMDTQATLADPQFKKREQPSFTDTEFATLADVGTRLQATSMRLKEFSKGPGFDELATRLHERAAELVTVVQAKNADGVRKTLVDMKATCKECHKKFR